MKRNYLLTVLGLVVLTFSNCEKSSPDVEKKISCMHTVEYWRMHPDEWQLSGFEFGRGNYTKEEALEILFTPTKGNYLVAVMQELIALRLNAANGNTCEDIIFALVAAEDHLFMNIEEGQRIPPYGDAYSNSEDSKDLAKDLRAMNQGKVPTSCCTASEGKGK